MQIHAAFPQIDYLVLPHWWKTQEIFSLVNASSILKGMNLQEKPDGMVCSAVFLW